MDKLIFGAGILLLCIIIGNGVPEHVVFDLDEARESLKGNFIEKYSPICIIIQSVRVINTKKRGCYNPINRPKEGLLNT